MRYALALVAAALFAPATLRAADPPVTFQMQPFERLLNDMRSAADIVGGEKAVKAFNAGIKDKLGDKGFEGLDLGKPIVGYVVLQPKLEETVAVVALPFTNEKDFIALCDRWNGGEKAKDLGKGIWELPPLEPGNKARMKFSGGYAYIAYGANPESALDDKALIAPNKLHDPAENALFMGKFHFDRLTPEFKKSLPGHLADIKKKIEEAAGGAGPLGPIESVIKAALPDLEKMLTRYFLLLGGADTATLRLNMDVPTSDLAVEFTLTPKKDTALAKSISDFKQTNNQFAGLITSDTVAGFKARLPFVNDERKSAGAKMLEEGQKELGNNAPPAAKAMLDELFKGLTRTIKTGEADIVGGLRGPNKDGDFTLVGEIAFEDPSALEKEFKKFYDADAPEGEKDRMKWNADKAGKVNIHTYKLPPGGGFFDISKPFGGDKALLAFAFAPKGIFIVVGSDPVAVIKDALAVKPVEAPMLDIVVNPARIAKLVEKFGGNALEVEKIIGKEDKLFSALSLKVSGGQELKIRLGMNMRILPRAVFGYFSAEEFPGDKPVEPPEKK